MWWLYVEHPSPSALPFCPSDLIKGNTPSRTVSNSCSGAASLKRDQRSLFWPAAKIGSWTGVPVRAALRSFRACSFVEPLDEEQIGELLDDRERIRNAARPHGVPDLVDLGLEFTRDHDCVSPGIL